MNNPPKNELDAGLTDYQRRTADHTLACMTTGPDGRDILDSFDPCLLDRPPGRRSKVDADRLLSILNELERRDCE
jgi:hypothetical protein